MKEIATQNWINDLDTTPIASKGQDIMNAILYHFRYTSEIEHTFTSEELASLVGQSKQTLNVRINSIDNFIKNYTAISLINENENITVVTYLFDKIKLDKNTGSLYIKLGSSFKELLDTSSGVYFKYLLEESLSLKSQYSKILYRQLRQWRFSGRLYISKEKLFFILNPPKAYTASQINQFILKPALVDLIHYFPDLKMTINKSSGRGRPVKSYTFTFTPFKRELKSKSDYKIKSSIDYQKVSKAIKEARKVGIASAYDVDLNKVRNDLT